jgi:hypothetical protein
VEEWQRRLVDPNWGGGKFGSYPGFAGPVGTAMLLASFCIVKASSTLFTR